MKLYITTPSPFARKVRIVALEKGLSEQIEQVVVDPYGNAPQLLQTNPVVQVPTLIAKDGLPLNDSPVICEYLDRLGGGDDLLPPSGSADWLRVKRLETLGNQALEMGVKLVLEKRRPENERSAMWIERWTTNMGRALDALEAEDLSADRIDLGSITAAIALTWIGFRHPDYDWKTGRPKLVAFQSAMETRESFKATFPQ
ncbi:glutathione S-transferase N-terminal domain-containing protein [Brevundimonas sp.]|uniref:glutathione S-transferase N-terminal domain-containing protein n=1 Tax=Brevundimonas sp. TaxID=1871086 RepID=UPI002FCC3439